MKATFLIAILMFVLPSLSAQSVSKEQLKKLNDIVGSYETEFDQYQLPEDEEKGACKKFFHICPFDSKYAIIGYGMFYADYAKDPEGHKFALVDRDGNIVLKTEAESYWQTSNYMLARSYASPMIVVMRHDSHIKTLYDTECGVVQNDFEDNEIRYKELFSRATLSSPPNPKYLKFFIRNDDYYKPDCEGIVRRCDMKEILPRKYFNIQAVYDNYFSVSDSTALHYYNPLTALVDSNGVFLTNFIYETVWRPQVQKEGVSEVMWSAWGGRPFYEQKAEPSNGKVFEVEIENKIGFINDKGKELIPLIFEINSPDVLFWNGELAFAYGQVNGKGYVCDGKGNKVCEVGNDKKVHLWQDCNVIVYGGKNSPAQIDTIYDRKGKVTDRLPVNKSLEWHFSGGKWTLKSDKGRKIAGPFDKYKFSGQVHEENLFIVGNGDKWGMIDKTGKVLIPIEKLRVDFKKCGTVEVQEEKDFYQIYSKEGKLLSEENFRCSDNPEIYFGYGPVPDGLWFCNAEGKWGLCRLKDMKVIVPFVCEKTGTELKFGMATAFYKGRWYFINELGEGLPDEAYQQNK
jgi:hypothetical protein